MGRPERVARYQEQSQIVDELTGRGEKDEALRLLASLRDEAAAAGDEDYRAFLVAQHIGYSSDAWAKA